MFNVSIKNKIRQINYWLLRGPFCKVTPPTIVSAARPSPNSPLRVGTMP